MGPREKSQHWEEVTKVEMEKETEWERTTAGAEKARKAHQGARMSDLVKQIGGNGPAEELRSE